MCKEKSTHTPELDNSMQLSYHDPSSEDTLDAITKNILSCLNSYHHPTWQPCIHHEYAASLPLH